MISARCLCLVLVAGCATPMSSLRDDNRRLNDTVADLRGDRRAQDRKLRDLQHQLDELRAHAPDGEPAVPPLPVVVAAPLVAPSPAPPPASPDGARVVGVSDDGTEIVYEGEAVTGRPPAGAVPAPATVADEPPVRRAVATAATRPAASRPSPPPSPPLADLPVVSDRLEVTHRVPPISARAAVRGKTRDHEPPSERGGTAGGDYRAAVELVKAGSYADALAALRAFVQRYPRHDYADNAQYWIGEVFYAQKDYVRALAEFRRVVEVYPRGNKVPDALLKVGYCYQATGQGEKARAVLEQVVNLYPKSEPAALAAKRLEAP